MLAGEYGQWINGKQLRLSLERERVVQSSPTAAAASAYGIEVTEHSTLGGGGWSLAGGLVGRVGAREMDVELFVKQSARTHGPARAVLAERDFSYEVFLLVRSGKTRRAEVIKRWSFSADEVEAVFPESHRRRLRDRSRTDAEIDRILERTAGVLRVHSVRGYLTLGPGGATAVVTVKGLKRPFEERVDLSEVLLRSP